MKQALYGLLVQLQEDESTWIRASIEAKSPCFITYLWAEFEPQVNDHEVRPSHEAQSGHKALNERLGWLIGHDGATGEPIN